MTSRILIAVLGVFAFGCGGARSSAPVKSLPTKTTKSDTAATSSMTNEIPAEGFRKNQPAAGPPRSFQFPPLKRFSLPQGIEVFFVERHSLPTVSLRLVFAEGSRQDPARKRGVASVCMAMLSEGTRKLDKTAFDEALADLASSISSRAGSDQQVVSMSTLTEQFDKTFSLYADVLTRPGFRSVDFKRLIARRLEQLKQIKGSPGSVARRLTRTILFGQDHPLGRVVTGRSLRAIRLRDCRRYFSRYIRPQGAKLFVVGDITEAQIRSAFSIQKLAAWKGKPRVTRDVPQPKPMKGKLFFVHIPKAAQSSIRLTHFGPARKAEDYLSNTLMASLFAGSFSGRMNMNLREDKGYSYGARGGFHYSREYGEFVAGASVRSDATWQSLLELHREFSDMQTQTRPATNDELARERQGAILSLPAKFATAGETLRQYSQLVYFGLPLDYYDSIVDGYQGVTLEQVNQSAQRHLKPNQLRILLVGDAMAPMIHRVDGKDVPLTDRKGKQMTLKQVLSLRIPDGALGPGGLVFLDVDGRVRSPGGTGIIGTTP